MVENKKLKAWADKLLDTGKRNNLISFKDTKASTAEIVVPDCESIFAKCSVGRVFEIVDPKISDSSGVDSEETSGFRKVQPSRIEYKNKYANLVKNEKSILVYAQVPNPISAVKSIAKKAKERLDETGINVSHLAFGFLKWNERDNSEIFYYAPLLLVHVNVITGTIIDPVRIEIADDDVVVNPTFNYFIQSTYGVSLPEFEDGDTLSGYFAKVAHIVDRMNWMVIPECKLGIFSFLKMNMYRDLKDNHDRILNNPIVKTILNESTNTQQMAGGLSPIRQGQGTAVSDIRRMQPPP